MVSIWPTHVGAQVGGRVAVLMSFRQLLEAQKASDALKSNGWTASKAPNCRLASEERNADKACREGAVNVFLQVSCPPLGDKWWLEGRRKIWIVDPSKRKLRRKLADSCEPYPKGGELGGRIDAVSL